MLDFFEIDAVAFDEGPDLALSPGFFLPPAEKSGAKRAIENGAEKERARGCVVEPAEQGLAGDAFDDDIAGLTVAISYMSVGRCGGSGLGGLLVGHGGKKRGVLGNAQG